ncbi:MULTISPECIES: OmpA family protein [unclassified Shewanella]|uniref:OmpA/MotB family protein n=1 Tax=unclassified Shewanella TaxID=196818 RepID=UPI001BBC0462|nr:MULTISPECIES: OmpA family protein [unclassified Shewanella]GIU15826.1 chemotaxis protein MotB [Shewanella sp. MBTL60-112-B1]GIU39470.1 chemotaxis protein MotB [Shewanella sp. MBTL60-112-B2]
MSRFRRKPVNIDEENPYWMSFSDLMSALLVIFILAAMALILELTQTKNQVDEAIEEIKKAEMVRRNILHDIKTELSAKNIVVEITENETVLRIPEQQLTFASNKFDIPEDESTQNAVIEIGNTIHRAILKDKRFAYLDTVFIEGHTDSRRSPRQKGNWGLSTFRAISLWELWNDKTDLAPRFDKIQNSQGQTLFSVSGYSSTRRVNEQELTPDDMQQNRRIDIRFTVKKPSFLDLESIKEQF